MERHGDTLWEQIHFGDAPLVDMHVHPTLKVFLFKRVLTARLGAARAFNPLSMRSDFVSLRRGGLDVLLSTVYAPEREIVQDCLFLKLIRFLMPITYRQVFGRPYFKVANHMLDLMEEQVASSVKDGRRLAQMAKSAPELDAILAQGPGRPIAVVHNIEGAHSLDGKLENLRAFFDRGVAYLTLAHFYKNAAVHPVFPYPEDMQKMGCFKYGRDLTLGLTKFGEDVIEAMIEMGMILDISHCTPPARKRIYEMVGTRIPLIASHVGAYEINPSPYNLKDWEIKKIAAGGGLVAVIFMNYWLMPHATKRGLNFITRTISHIARVGGIDTVGIGSDFDGFTDPPDEIKDATQLPQLTRRLLAEGYHRDEVEKIWGGNAIRVLREGWRRTPDTASVLAGEGGFGVTDNDQAKWTVMVYLAGDNNLSTAGDNDLGEMRQVGSTADVNIVAEFDNAGKHGTQRFHVQLGGENETVVKLGETDSGSPEVLLDFVRWAKETYPADRYALVLWNHGGGWEPSEVEKIAEKVGTKDFSEREANERRTSSLGRAFFRTTMEKIYKLPTVSERAIASDDGTGHSLDTVELGNVLRETKEILGQKLNLLGMDACLMSNLEVAYQVQDFVNYIVASEENEPNHGWPYDAVLAELVKTPEMSAVELAKLIVKEYVQSYIDRGYTGAVTQSALDLSQVGAVVDPLDELAAAIIAHLPKARGEMGEALYQTTAHFWRGTLWDIAQFCQELAKETKDGRLKTAAKKVEKALHPKRKAFVIAESHNGAKVKGCGGCTIYLPPRILHKVSPFYKELDYAKHRWLEMLEAYHSA